MNNETSAGAVIYHKNPVTKKNEFLILHYGAGHWDFPKGKLEKEETMRQAAIREVKEETGLDVKLDKDFEQSFSYYYKNKLGNLINKDVTFYVAESPTTDVTLSYEHLYYKWLPLEEAIKQLTYTNARQLLQMVNQYILSRNVESAVQAMQ